MADHALFDYSGGWNTRKPPVLLADNEFERADNVRLMAGGGWVKRRGYTRIGNDDANTSVVTGVYPYSTPSGTRHMLRTKNAKIEYVTGGTWTDITAALTVTTTADVKHVFTTFRGNAVGTNGTDIPWKWPGTGNAAVIARAIGGGADTIDKAAAVCTHKERLILGDVTATETAVQTRYESVIWPSDAGTLDTWSASPTGRIHIGQGDGDSIICSLSLLGYLIVFKQNSTWRISDFGVSATQNVIRVASVGTSSKHGAVVANGIVYFLAPTGLLYSYDPRQGDSPDALRELTTPKIGDWNIENLTESRLPYSHLAHWERTQEIVCFVDDVSVSGTTPGQAAAWVWNIAASGWSRWFYDKRINVSAYGWNAVDGLQSPILGTHDGFVNMADVLGVDGPHAATITMTAYLAPTSCGSPGQYKGWRWAYVYTNSRQLDQGLNDVPTVDTFSMNQDEVLPATGALTTGFSMSAPAQAGASTDMYDSFSEARLSGHGRFTRLRFVHTTSRRIRFSGILLNYEPEGPRR